MAALEERGVNLSDFGGLTVDEITVQVLSEPLLRGGVTVKRKPLLIDFLSIATLNQKTGEICCPNCGSWTNMSDLTPGENVATCPLCTPQERGIAA